MKTPMNASRPAPSAFALALLVLPLRFDDPAKPQEKPKLPIPVIGPAAEGEDDPHVEMARLFGQIERDLREIDKLLTNASAGGASTTEAEERAAKAIAGIDELLTSSQQRSRAVVEGIDRLFELADHPHQPGGT